MKYDRGIVTHEIKDMLGLTENLDDDIYKTNSLHFQLQLKHNTFAKGLRTETIKLNKLVAARKKYYLGKMPPEYYAKYPLPIQIGVKDVNRYIDVDEMIVTQRDLVDEIEMCLKIVEDAKKRLSFRTNDIRVILDYRKFKAGIV